MTSPFDDDAELAEFEAAQRREYTQYVAAAPIDIGAARAYNTGDPIPASNVDSKGRLVIGRHTCAGHEKCEHFNEPTRWADPELIKKVATTPAKSTSGGKS